MHEQKVFCIGFHKTGTKSLSSALKQLGYCVTGPNWTRDADIAKTAWPKAKELIPKFDAFQDNPWPLLYKEIDAYAPNSKFILTIRNSPDWLRSVVTYFAAAETPMRRWIYGFGCPSGHEQAYLDRYNAHNQAVLSYFKNRPQDILVMDIAGGEGWEKLCGFLDVDLMHSEFPHQNQAGKSG
jgi:hypothetical protein